MEHEWGIEWDMSPVLGGQNYMGPMTDGLFPHPTNGDFMGHEWDMTRTNYWMKCIIIYNHWIIYSDIGWSSINGFPLSEGLICPWKGVPLWDGGPWSMRTWAHEMGCGPKKCIRIINLWTPKRTWKHMTWSNHPKWEMNQHNPVIVILLGNSCGKALE